jgi:hypothetical protein
VPLGSLVRERVGDTVGLPSEGWDSGCLCLVLLEVALDLASVNHLEPDVNMFRNATPQVTVFSFWASPPPSSDLSDSVNDILVVDVKGGMARNMLKEVDSCEELCPWDRLDLA